MDENPLKAGQEIFEKLAMEAKKAVDRLMDDGKPPESTIEVNADTMKGLMDAFENYRKVFSSFSSNRKETLEPESAREMTVLEELNSRISETVASLFANNGKTKVEDRMSSLLNDMESPRSKSSQEDSTEPSGASRSATDSVRRLKDAFTKRLSETGEFGEFQKGYLKCLEDVLRDLG